MRARRLGRLHRIELADGLVVHEARSWRARLIGLALMRALPSGHALLIRRCRSVHTCGMRFELDVAFLDEEARAVRVIRSLRRWRFARCARAAAVLEAGAGEIDRFLHLQPHAELETRREASRLLRRAP